ncbi:MAG: T9SS type A sorting domain-containing protein, partial [Bacteroidota bacterium]
NPANNTFRLKYNSEVETQVQLSIYDYLGNEVLSLSESCIAGANEKTVDCSVLSTGYYLVKVSCGAGVQTQGLVILK